MLLVIGSAASGKRQYIRSLGYTPKDMSKDPQDACPVLYDLQELVWQSPGRAMELLPALCKKAAVLCCEVGSGVIPQTPEEREAREATGRLCIALAQQAEKVVRLVAGIPQVIKG